ncbi:MAG: DUF1552 domain-containing protein [Sandaracinaceae bacterium]
MKWTRRSWLRGIGLGAAAVALPSMGRADPPARPMRLASIITPCGTIRARWGRRESDTDFSFREILRPFEPVRDQVLVLSGIDMAVAQLGDGGGHQRGPGGILTGQPLLPGDFCGGIDCSHGRSGWAAGPSIDQVVADRVAGRTRIRSLELGVRLTGANNRHRVSFRAANQPLPPDNDPFHVYQRIFAGTGMDAARLERVRRERRSVLDLVGDELRSLERWMPGARRDRLDAHLESIRDAERQLDAAAGGAVCEAPPLEERFDPLAGHFYPTVSRLHLELTALAFACDATRVMTMFYSGGTSQQTFPWLRIREQHHQLSHEPDSNRAAQEKLVAINAWYAEEVARFVARLASIPEGDGTLLDHTLVFFGNELAKGNAHTRDDMRLLLAGGRAAGLRPGRWLWCDHRPHNDLLVSLGRGMGLDLERFGHPDFCTGPIRELGIP